MSFKWALQFYCRTLQSSPRLSAQTPARCMSTGSSERPPFDPSRSTKFVQPPNPKWTYGQGISSEGAGAVEWKTEEKLGWQTMELEKMESRDIYRLLTSAVTPRPIAFISSLSSSGVPNLAPFSYFSLVAHDPPLLSISFSLSKTRPKDTRENIKATKEFVVNIISEPFIEAANSCAVEAPADVDEWVVSGLTREPSVLVKPPRVRESAVSLECQLYHFHDICPPNSNEVTNSLVLGLIKYAHVRNAVLNEDGSVDLAKLKPIARFGGITYARVGDAFELPRPSWREIKSKVNALTNSGGDNR